MLPDDHCIYNLRWQVIRRNLFLFAEGYPIEPMFRRDHEDILLTHALELVVQVIACRLHTANGVGVISWLFPAGFSSRLCRLVAADAPGSRVKNTSLAFFFGPRICRHTQPRLVSAGREEEPEDGEGFPRRFGTARINAVTVDYVRWALPVSVSQLRRAFIYSVIQREDAPLVVVLA